MKRRLHVEPIEVAIRDGQADLATKLIPFPSIRRRHFIEKSASRFVNMTPVTAEKQVRALLNRQRGVMERRGFSQEIVDAQLHSLEQAIRAAMWRAVITPDGAA